MADAHAGSDSTWDFFLVHSSAAKPRARELYDLLVEQGAKPFIDAETISAGTTWDASLDVALRESSIAVVMVSESFDDAHYANEEVAMAISCFRNYGAPLVYPVYVDGMSPAADAPYGLNRLQGDTVAEGDSMEQVAAKLMQRLRHVRTASLPTAERRAQRSELVVDWQGSGSNTYRSIQRALDEAGPGATVEVHPGVYEESLTITQPVNLVGVGDVDAIIIQAFNGTAVTLTADGGSLSGLTIRQKGGTFQYQAIDVAAGLPSIEGCIINGGAHSAIRIRGTASPVIQRNIISGTAKRGVELGDNASVQLLDNWIDGLAEDGVWIGGSAHAIVRDNQIDDCILSGIHLNDDARVRIKANTIARCGHGIFARERSYATIKNNVVESSRHGGLAFVDGGAGIVSRNHIRYSEHDQVMLSTTGEVIFEENLIDAGRAAGIAVRDRSHATLARNVIEENQGDGVSVVNGRCTVYENWVRGNTGDGVWLSDCDHSTVRLNIIEDNGANGLNLFESLVMVEHNRIDGNDAMGIEARGGEVNCRHNAIMLNRLAPITLWARAGSVSIEANEISALDRSGVVDDPGIVVNCLDPNGRADITRNWVHHCTTAIDLYVYDESATVGVHGNFLDDNDLAVAFSGHGPVGDRVMCWENRCSGNRQDFDGGDESVEVWSGSNTSEDTLSEHMQKVRSLGLERRLEKLDATGGAIARHLRQVADDVRASNGASVVPVAVESTD